mmetsp:Transcript_10031/g.22518  ORF Transcript_10031/g.22518 Transcript_10031/m.22518 type:complete len:216 (-) Transcript_10031:106-753(-)
MGNTAPCCTSDEDKVKSELGVNSKVVSADDVAIAKGIKDGSQAAPQDMGQVNLFAKRTVTPPAEEQQPIQQQEVLALEPKERKEQFVPAAADPLERENTKATDEADIAKPEKPPEKIPPNAERIQVVVARASLQEELGVDLRHCKTHLRIRKIHTDKAIHEHNRKHEGTDQVLGAGDLILSVNGVTGHDIDMISECKHSTSLTLTVVKKASLKAP